MFISLPICIKLVYYQISRCRLFPPQPMAAAYFFITHFITGSEFIGEYLLISRKHFDMIDHIKKLSRKLLLQSSGHKKNPAISRVLYT